MNTNPNITTNKLEKQFVSNIINNHGVVLSNRTPASISERIKSKSDNIQSNKMIVEDPWTLANMIERPTFRSSYNWTTALASGTVISTLRIPQDLIATSITDTPFSRFTFWKGEIKLSFQVTATPLHQGMVVAVFVPLSTTSFVTGTLVPNFRSASVNQCVYLYANANTAGEMTIPFNHPKGYLNLLNSSALTVEDSLGTLYLFVLNQLSAAAASTTNVNISLFSQFLNNQFKVPRVSTIVAQSGYLDKPIGVINKIGNTFSNVLGAISHVAMPAFKVTKMLTSLDKPTIPTTDLPIMMRATDPFNYNKGPDHVDKMTLYPESQPTIMPHHFASEQDEMQFDYLKKRYTYLGTYDFSTSQVPGTALAFFDMSPFPITTGMGPNIKTFLPLISYLTYPFEFWRGGFTYKFQIVATSFQTGKLYFALNYGSLTSPSSLLEATSQYGVAMELNQGTNEFEFTVPYVADTPYKKVPNSKTPNLFSSMGRATLYVMNQLVAPNNTPTTVQINVFVAGADDYEVNILGTSNAFIPTANFPPAIVAQSGVAPLNTAETNTDVAITENILAPNDELVNDEQIQFGSKFTSIKDTLLRYQLVFYKEFKPELNTYLESSVVEFPISQVFIGVGNLQNVSPGLFNWGSHLFRQFRGNMRFRVRVFQTGNISDQTATLNSVPFVCYFTPFIESGGSPAHYNAATYNVQFNPTSAFVGSTATYTGLDHSRLPMIEAGINQTFAQFEVPFSTVYQTVLVHSGPSENYLFPDTYNTLSSLGKLVIIPQRWHEESTVNTEQPVNYVVKIYASLGDEAQLGTLYQVPPIIINSYQVGSSWVPLGNDKWNV